MKNLILILLVLAALTAGSKPKVGYYAYVQKGNQVEQQYFVDLDDVYLFVERIYPGTCIDFESELKKSPYVRVLAHRKEIYVEKKRINKKGKFKRL